MSAALSMYERPKPPSKNTPSTDVPGSKPSGLTASGATSKGRPSCADAIQGKNWLPAAAAAKAAEDLRNFRLEILVPIALSLLFKHELLFESICRARPDLQKCRVVLDQPLLRLFYRVTSVSTNATGMTGYAL